MTLILTFDIEDVLWSSLWIQKWILEVIIRWKVVLHYFIGILVQKLFFLCFRYANFMLISYYANKKVPQGCRRGNQT